MVNLEHVKTTVLIILVLSGLVLTFFLWYGNIPYHDYSEPVFQEVFFFEEPREECRILTPQDIIIPLEDEKFAVFRRGQESFHLLWDNILALPGSGNYEEVTPEVLPEEAMSLIVHFYPQIFPEMLLQSPESEKRAYGRGEVFIQNNGTAFFLFGKGSEGLLIKINDERAVAALANVLSEVLNIEHNDYYLLRDFTEPESDDLADESEEELAEERGEEAHDDSGDPVHSVESGDEAHELAEVAAEIEDEKKPVFFRTTKEIYLPGENFFVAPNLDFKKNEVPVDDLLRAIFVDKDLARRIAEPDGTLIFTDGEKGLRISDNIEYTAPGLEKGVVTYSYRSALQKANEYFCFYGGWPEALYMRDVIEVNGNIREKKSYRGVWGYYIEGLPVLGSIITAASGFNDQGLFYYKRPLYEPQPVEGKTVAVAEAEKAVKKALRIYREGLYSFEDEKVIELNDVFIAYITDRVDGSEKITASPVWVVNVEEQLIYLHAVDLEEFYPGENDEYIKS